MHHHTCVMFQEKDTNDVDVLHLGKYTVLCNVMEHEMEHVDILGILFLKHYDMPINPACHTGQGCSSR